MQPEVPFLTTNVEKLKCFGQERTKLWKEKSNEIERIFIYLAIDPPPPPRKCDLQGHMIFYMTYAYMDYQDLSDSIQRIIREISAIESLMTSYLLDRKWHK